MPVMRRLVPAAVALLVTVLGGCGGSTEADRVLARPSSGPLLAEDRLVEQRLVNERDIATTPAGSARRAFLEYWAAISVEDWASAVRYIDMSVRRALDPGYLVDALRAENRANIPVKPLLRSVRLRRGNTSIRYNVRTAQGTLRPTSSTWRQRGGSWYMVYSATLDASYGSAVQLGVQNEIDPDAQQPSPKALRAGQRATRDQAETLAP